MSVDVPRGLYCAMVTPMRSDGAIDLDAVPPLVERLLDQGVDGLVVLGTTGEFSELTPAEQRDVAARTVQACAGRIPVVGCVGELGTHQAMASARELSACGVDNLLVLPPLYWDGLDGEAVKRHLVAVAGATDLPVLVYDYPASGRLPVDPHDLCDAADEQPRIVGVKQTVMDVGLVEHMSTVVQERSPSLVLGVGFEQLAVPSHLLGGRLVISGLANFCAPLMRRLLDALARDDADEVLVAHRQVLRLAEIYRIAVPPIASIKAAAAMAGMPLTPTARTVGLQRREHSRIARVLDETGLVASV